MRYLIITLVIGYAAYLAFPLTKVPLGLDLRGGVHIEASVDFEELKRKLGKDDLTEKEKSDALNQALTVVRERINKKGIEEAEVRQGGQNRIVLQIPGYADRQAAENLVTQVGYLEFALVADDDAKLGLALKGKQIPGYRLLHLSSKDGTSMRYPILVKEKPEFDGSSLRSSSVEFDPNMGKPEVSLNFNSKGTDSFAAVTEQNVGKQLAIILDDRVVSAPVIQTTIFDGRARITGDFDINEARELSLVLNAGALPAKIKVLQSEKISATLGKDSIEKGMKAGVFGVLFVAIFMLVYYRKLGLVAVFSLCFNVVLILGAVVYLKATMTLPGIAGLILTIGMAVDANVLIFERIREELKNGKAAKASVEAGFDKVYWTILDANITTLITSAILYYCGKGPVKGFAVVLMVGIISTLFTALYAGKTILFSLVNMDWFAKNLSLPSIAKEGTAIPFMKFRKKAYAISIAMAVLALTAFFIKGDKKYGVDFSGGGLLELSFQESVSIDELRQKIGQDVVIQYFGSQKEVIIRAKSGQLDTIKEAVANAGLSTHEIVREEDVGPVVGKELKTSSLWAIVISLLGIMIYITIRFEGKYSITSIIALVHDVIITAGIYALIGSEFNVPTIAALLTVVGYSLNDTIVVFDRIREQFHQKGRKTFETLIDTAINETLNRSVLTSLTTLFVVISMLLYGGGLVFDFSVTLLVGIIVGTYSSIFVAAPLLIDLNKNSKKKA